MSYNYQQQRPFLFTDEGTRLFLKIRDNTQRLLREAGACRMQEMIRGCTGDVWNMLACVDRMIELGEIEELTDDAYGGQYRVFIVRT